MNTTLAHLIALSCTTGIDAFNALLGLADEDTGWQNAVVNGMNPTALAITSGNPDVLKAILLSGDNFLSEQIQQGENTLLHIACERGDEEAFNILKAYGVNWSKLVNAVNAKGRTALMLAIRSHMSQDVVNELLLAGSPVTNKAHSTGASALHYECRKNQPSAETVTYLIAKGADILDENEDGKNAIDLLNRPSTLEVLQKAIDKNAEVKKAKKDAEDAEIISEAFPEDEDE